MTGQLKALVREDFRAASKSGQNNRISVSGVRGSMLREISATCLLLY